MDRLTLDEIDLLFPADEGLVLDRRAFSAKLLDSIPAADPAERAEAADVLRSALSVLSDREREAVALRFGAELSSPEIGDHLGLHRLQIAIIPRNTASRRVVEKLDLRDEGIAVRYLAINGRWEDHIRYALTAEEWAERGQQLVEEWIGPPPAPVLRLRQRG